MKECFSCNKKFNPETEERVIITEKRYEIFFCEKCSNEGKHCDYAKQHSPR